MRRAGSIFSVSRFLAILTKEFIQMRRDRVTFAMMIGLSSRSFDDKWRHAGLIGA